MTDTTEPRMIGRWPRRIAVGLRILVGLLLLLTSANLVFDFLPQPDNLPAGAMAFTVALMQSGYMIKLIAATQFLVALSFISGYFVPLGIAIFAPFLVNSALFHLNLEPSGLPPSLVLIAVEIYLAWAYRGAFRPMLQARAAPGA